MIGLAANVVSPDVYAMVVLMCIVTSLVAPPALRALLARPAMAEGDEGPAGEGRP